MAKVVMGIEMSHSPLLGLEGARWAERGKDDMNNKRLNTIDGRYVDYDTVSRTTNDRYASDAILENFVKQDQQAQGALDRIADDLAKVDPDVVVIIGDDHYELFSAANMPAISIYHGEELLTHPEEPPEEGHWREQVLRAYAMDKVHRYPAHPKFAYQLIESLIEQEFDVGSAARVDDPKVMGFGHAFGFVIERLFRGRNIPVVPVALNTYYPPNAPTPRRCYRFGEALRKAIESSPLDLNVAVVGSGGLSHFLVEEELDLKIIKALKEKDAEALMTLSPDALISGSSEIRCWIAAAGAFPHLQNRWLDYVPARRTPAGTGIGLGFGTWY